jgi:CheY-like chemotaxis protein
MLGHELRNPLSAIAGAAGVLKQAPDVASAMGERARAVIDRQVQHLARLVDDLLDVGRVVTGKVRLNRRRLDLGALATSVMNAWRAAGRFARHDVTARVTSVWIEGDETRIEQVLDNLVGNALKYTPAGGRVTLSIEVDGPVAVLEVADSGPGLPPNLGNRMFELFVQGDRTLDRSQGGLGIGLTLVRSLIQLHGGTVEGTGNGPDKGAVFTVRLPRIPAPADDLRALPASRPPTIPRCIVIVEDNDDTREMLRVQLVTEGHRVYEAADGKTGVELVTSVAADIALVDVGLPGIDGYEVARRIRATERGKSVCLVALTGYGRHEDRVHALDAGFDAHLTKPVPPERLAAVIADVFEKPIGREGNLESPRDER